MSQLITRLYEDPVFFVHAYFHAMGWDQFNALGELEEDAIRFACGLDTAAGTTTPVWRVIKGYRMQGKTRVITIGTSLWRAFRDAERRIIYVSASADHARRILATVRASIDKCSFLRHLAPTPDQRDRIECFDMGPSSINPQPSFLAIGIDGQRRLLAAHALVIGAGGLGSSAGLFLGSAGVGHHDRLDGRGPGELEGEAAGLALDPFVRDCIERQADREATLTR